MYVKFKTMLHKLHPKSQKISHVNFFKKLNVLISGPFCIHFNPKTREFFSKNLALLLFKLDDNVTLCKKSENFHEHFSIWTPDQSTNWKMVGGYFIGASLCESTNTSWVQKLSLLSTVTKFLKPQKFKFSIMTRLFKKHD